jgi:hypothetical protein
MQQQRIRVDDRQVVEHGEKVLPKLLEERLVLPLLSSGKGNTATIRTMTSAADHLRVMNR